MVNRELDRATVEAQSEPEYIPFCVACFPSEQIEQLRNVKLYSLRQSIEDWQSTVWTEVHKLRSATELSNNKTPILKIEDSWVWLKYFNGKWPLELSDNSNLSRWFVFSYAVRTTEMKPKQNWNRTILSAIG